jgi:S1-C subfamily serine protease
MMKRIVVARHPVVMCLQLVSAAVVVALLVSGLHEGSFAASPARGHRATASPCGWIGARVKPMTEAFAASLGMSVPYGAIFDRPVTGSPAASAGIQAGDVLTTVNGNPLEKSIDLAGIIAAMAPGDTVNLGISRNGQRIEVALMVGQGKCQ